MDLNRRTIEEIVTEVVRRLEPREDVEVLLNDRHVYLSRQDIENLFGKGYQLTKAKNLSQPGQYLCKEKVNIVGPKGTIRNIAVFGPEKKDSQVEITRADTLVLGLKVPICESDKIDGTPGTLLMNGIKSTYLEKGLMVSKRFILLNETDAKRFNLFDGEVVQVKIDGERSLIFDEVGVRIDPKSVSAMYVDNDEANACDLFEDTRGLIIKKLGTDHE